MLPGTRLPVSLLTSPFQLGAAWAAFILGLGVLLTTMIPFFGVITTLQATIPTAVVIIWATFLFLGGLGVLLATFGRDFIPPRAAVLEVPSHVISGTAWLIYAVVPVLSGGYLAAASIGLPLCIASFLRVRAIMVSARITREVNDISAKE